MRGIVPDQIDEALARRPARRSSRSSGPTTVVVGHDMRPSSPGLAGAFAEGAADAGADVVHDRAGLDRPALLRLRPPRCAPARCSPRATTRRSTTGSRCAARAPQPVGAETGLDEIRDVVSRPGSRRRPRAPATITAARRARRLRRAPARRWPRWPVAGCKVVVDAGNGMAGLTAPAVLRPAGRRGRAGPDVLRARRHLPAPRGQPDRAGEPASTCRRGWSPRAPTSAWPSTATPTAASWSTSAATRSRPSTLTGADRRPRAGQGARRDGDPQPDHQPGRARDGPRARRHARSAPGSATPSSRRRWPRPTRSSVASTAATSTSATSGAPTPGCSPRCTRWPRSAETDRPLSRAARPTTSATASAARSTPRSPTTAATIGGRRGGVRRPRRRRGRPPRRAHRHHADWWFNVRPSNTEPLLRLNVEGADEATMARVRDDVLALIRSHRMNLDPTAAGDHRLPRLPRCARRRSARSWSASSAAWPTRSATTSRCCWSTRPAAGLRPERRMATWFDESRLDDEAALATADLRLRELAESGARVRREAVEAAAGIAAAVAAAGEPPPARHRRGRARLPAAARRARAVVPGAVRGLARARRCPGWAGGLDLVVVLAPDGDRPGHGGRRRRGRTPRLPGRRRLPGRLAGRPRTPRAAGRRSCRP